MTSSALDKDKSEDQSTTKVQMLELVRPSDDFQFNAFKSASEHFKEYKLHVVKGTQNNATINLDLIQTIAAKQ